MDYTIYVETMEGVRLGQVDFESISAVLRWRAPGTYKVILSDISEIDLRGKRLRICRGDKTVISGPITAVTEIWDGFMSSFTVTGKDDLALLETRLITPVPGGPPYTASSHHVVSGPLESVIHTYVAAHAGPDAIASRQIAGLMMGTDYGRGVSLETRARFVSLFKCIEGLAAIENFGLSMSEMTFRVLAPRHTEYTLSADLQNLLSFECVRSAPDANYFFVGGSGDGAARVITEVGRAESIAFWGKREGFLDQRDVSNTDELLRTAESQLAYISEANISFSGLATLDEVSLGDQIRVIYKGVMYEETIESMNLLVDSIGEVLTISNRQRTAGTFDAMKNMNDRLRFLEAVK